MKRVAQGQYVKVCYTGKFENGDVFDATESCKPLEVQVGAGQVIPGFEEALIGMEQNEKKTITLPPDRAYGVRDDTLERTVMRSSFPPEIQPEVGAIIAFRTPKGANIPAMVTQVNSETVTVDFNHPLAGKTLLFDLEIAEINDQPSAAPESCGSQCCCS